MYFIKLGVAGQTGSTTGTMMASWDEDSDRASAPGTQQPPARGCEREDPRLSSLKCSVAAPLGLQCSPTAFPALWKTPPSHHRLPLTQAASLADGWCSPQPQPKESPFVQLSQRGPCAGWPH